jgi:MFS family permease
VLVWLTFQLGRELFNPWVGAVAALVVFSRPAMQRDVVLAYLDVPFEALVVGAVLLEVRRPRRGTAVLIVLLAAGLLRPEAWALSILYVAYLWRHLETRQRWRLSALAVLAPIIWILSDAIVAGDALHSLHGTAALADTADRRRSPGQVPFWTAKYFGYTLREPVIAALPVGLWFAYRRGLRSARLPLVVAGVLIAVFAVGPIFGLPLIGRYVRTPSILLALFYGLACFGWLSLAPSQARHRWAIAGWLCVAASLVFIPSQANMLHGLRVRRDRDSAFYGDLRSLAHAAPVRAAFAACPKITTTDHRPIPYLRWWLGGRPGSVGTVEHHASRQAKLFLVPRATQVPHHFYGVAFPHVPPPAGYRVLYRDRSFRLYAAPECFTAPPS